jgi:hypothetical protein
MSERQYEDGTLTRQQVIAALAERGHTVTPTTLGFWQEVGLIRFPHRRWSDGATRAFYPAEVVDILDQHIRSGRKLKRDDVRCPCCGRKMAKARKALRDSVIVEA